MNVNKSLALNEYNANGQVAFEFARNKLTYFYINWTLRALSFIVKDIMEDDWKFNHQIYLLCRFCALPNCNCQDTIKK